MKPRPTLFFAALVALAFTTGLVFAQQAPQGPQGGPPSGPPPPEPKREVHFPPPPDPLTQEYVAKKFIYSLLAGQTDTLAPLFAEDVRPYITDQLVERLRGQFSWFYGIIGGDFEEFHSGQLDSAYFREYRLANESNDRSPLIVVQVVFPDSATPTLVGAQVKNFLGGNEKRLSGEQTWKIKGQEFDIHSVILANLDTGSVLAIQFYDESPDTLSQEMVARIGIPLIKEAIARGYVDTARAALESGRPLLDRIGVVFIRKDPRQGMAHARIGFGPEDYGPLPEAGKPKKGKTAPAKKKAPAKK